MGNSDATEEVVPHRWKFVRIGGVEQVAFRDGQDIIHLDQLDQKLWGALASPAQFLEFDTRTLEILDTDKDGRLRAPEIIAVSRWVRDVYADPDLLFKGGDSVPLAAISKDSPVGQSLQAAIGSVLRLAGKEGESVVTLADVTQARKVFAAATFNGDGVMPPESAADEETRSAISDIISVQPPALDLSGKPGITKASLDSFIADATALLAWDDKGRNDPAVMPLGEQTDRAAQSVDVLRTKIEDYFARARLSGFEPRAASALNRSEADYLAFANKDLTIDTQEIAHLPLARIEGDRPLPLRDGLNPAWSSAMARFTSDAVTPALSERATLSKEDWSQLLSRFSAHDKWLATKPKTPVEKLGLPRLRQIVRNGALAKIQTLLDQDLGRKGAQDELHMVEKLIHVQRDLVRLLNNFVSFTDFYSRQWAIFQAGTLYLDARSCDLCLRVADANKHATLAGLAKAYLAYCDCTRPGGEKMTIVAAFTAGSSDYLMLGRNGIFYDRKGRDWDATITKIIENPISIRQAFWSPYKKFIRMIEEQVAKRAAAAEAASNTKLTTAATQVAQVDPTKPPIPVAPKKVDVGTVAAIGVALGSLATFLGLMFTKFIDLGWWMPLALIGLMLAISGPSVLVAWLKLRQRNLAPILDANGWAVNGRMKINVPFGGALSKTPKLPPGSRVLIGDPFYESHVKRNIAIILLIVLGVIAYCWRLGILNPYLPANFQRRIGPVQVITTTNVPPTPTVTATNTP